mgnify:CR=1 FL=1
MAKQKSKGRKIGRNKKWCEIYRLTNRREKNKTRRQVRHQKRVVKKEEKLARMAKETK